MTKKELHQKMTAIREMAEVTPIHKIIAISVQLGMDYQEELIKAGIDIVFNEIHKNDIK